jgi:uncharacterized membrane protein YeiB
LARSACLRFRGSTKVWWLYIREWERTGNAIYKNVTLTLALRRALSLFFSNLKCLLLFSFLFSSAGQYPRSKRAL